MRYFGIKLESKYVLKSFHLKSNLRVLMRTYVIVVCVETIIYSLMIP